MLLGVYTAEELDDFGVDNLADIVVETKVVWLAASRAYELVGSMEFGMEIVKDMI